jgi:hypothetical protein
VVAAEADFCRRAARWRSGASGKDRGGLQGVLQYSSHVILLTG